MGTSKYVNKNKWKVIVVVRTSLKSLTVQSVGFIAAHKFLDMR